MLPPQLWQVQWQQQLFPQPQAMASHCLLWNRKVRTLKSTHVSVLHEECRFSIVKHIVYLGADTPQSVNNIESLKICTNRGFFLEFSLPDWFDCSKNVTAGCPTPASFAADTFICNISYLSSEMIRNSCVTLDWIRTATPWYTVTM